MGLPNEVLGVWVLGGHLQGSSGGCFFLQSLPEAALLSGTRSHSGREEQTAAGSAVFGFNPLHMEMCWEESSSSEPSCSPALG